MEASSLRKRINCMQCVNILPRFRVQVLRENEAIRVKLKCEENE